jgi:hypothetical protein
MQRHQQNLERLCSKFQSLYGENDPLVQQIRVALTEKQKQNNTLPRKDCGIFSRRASAFQSRACRL